MNAETFLLRQVHPHFIQQDRITSQVFTPRSSNGNRLSVYDGDQITPEDAWRHYTQALANASAGVVVVTVSECTDENLAVASDPADYPEHVVIAFKGMSTGQVRSVAKRLRAAAQQRGWQYRDGA